MLNSCLDTLAHSKSINGGESAMIVLALLISCRLQFSKSDSHSKRENRQPLQQGLPTKCFGDHLQVRVIHLELLSFFHLLSTQYKRQVSCSLRWTSSLTSALVKPTPVSAYRAPARIVSSPWVSFPFVLVLCHSLSVNNAGNVLWVV